jgi:hypothetical protein
MESPYIKVLFRKKIYVSGVLIVPTDVVTVHLNDEHQALHSFPTADLIVVDVLDEGRGFTFDRRVAAQDFRACDIAGVHAQHDGSCPEVCDFSIDDADAAIASVEVDGAAISLPNLPYALSEAGAALFQADLRTWLLSNYPAGLPQPYVTAVWDDPNIDINIYGSVLDFQTLNAGGTPIPFVNSCD